MNLPTSVPSTFVAPRLRPGADAHPALGLRQVGRHRVDVVTDVYKGVEGTHFCYEPSGNPQSIHTPFRVPTDGAEVADAHR